MISADFVFISIAVHGSGYAFLAGVVCGIGLGMSLAWMIAHPDEAQKKIKAVINEKFPYAGFSKTP